MADDLIVNKASSQTTHVYGRTLNSARMHHFVIDGTRDPKEELTPVEVFLSSISACCVQWVEQFAREDEVSLYRLEVAITGSRTTEDPTRFQRVDIEVTATGPDQAQMEDFVSRFKARCPLYRTVSAATEVVFSAQVEVAS
jgi:uncharacterized OsmC-like protein